MVYFRVPMWYVKPPLKWLVTAQLMIGFAGIFDGRKAEMMCTHVCLILSKMVHINVYSYTLQIITPKNGFKVQY